MPAGSAQNQNDVFDLKALREITGGNSEIEKELAHLFIQTAESCLRRLEHLTAEDAQAVWSQVLHELKGAAANIRADALAEVCKQSEQLACDSQKRMAALMEIGQSYAKVKPLLEAL